MFEHTHYVGEGRWPRICNEHFYESVSHAFSCVLIRSHSLTIC